MGVKGSCYTSELSVRTSTEMNGRTVCCVSNSNSGMLTVGDATITIVSGKFLVLNTSMEVHACVCVCGQQYYDDRHKN